MGLISVFSPGDSDPMAQSIRTVLFWLHLTAGLLAGVVVLIMSATGVLLAFEKQAVYYADTRRFSLTPPASAAPLPLDAVLARVRANGLVAEPSAVAIRRDPAAPIALTVGGGAVAYADRYTGRLLGTGDAGVRAFFRSMTDWHRWLAASGEYRATGRAVTGASNLAFLFLVVSGAYLWIPRTWAWRAVRQVVWFRRGLAGKAMDFNGHNTIGVWSVLPCDVVASEGSSPTRGQQPGLSVRRESQRHRAVGSRRVGERTRGYAVRRTGRRRPYLAWATARRAAGWQA